MQIKFTSLSIGPAISWRHAGHIFVVASVHAHTRGHSLSERCGDLLYYYTKLPGKTFINLSNA